MPFLSPAKLLVVLVVALVVLGPDRLPTLARRVGTLWGDLHRLRQRLEADARASFPDLPSTERIHQAVRSPLTFLDDLADPHAGVPEADVRRGSGVTPAQEPPSTRPHPPGPADVLTIVDPGGAVHRVRTGGSGGPDGPGLN